MKIHIRGELYFELDWTGLLAAVPWRRRSVTGLSTPTVRFVSTAVLVGYMVDEVAWHRLCFAYFGFAPSVLFLKCFVLLFIYHRRYMRWFSKLTALLNTALDEMLTCTNKWDPLGVDASAFSGCITAGNFLVTNNFLRICFVAGVVIKVGTKSNRW
jgi:hypothetical protein